MTVLADEPMEKAAMSDLDSQVAYWDAAAATKTFTHPVHLPWLEGLARSAAILDYGCGYGRTMALLEQHGFERLAGVDTSSAMIARARDLHPAMRFAVLDTPPTVHDPDASVDVIRGMDPEVPPAGWTKEAVSVHRIGVGPHSISVGTARDDLVESLLTVHASPPMTEMGADSGRRPCRSRWWSSSKGRIPGPGSLAACAGMPR